ncbi:MAG: ABC transporter ATP-binding protein [Patescibacteria group bacterium]|nr:ABC transporter ATP-binding protein [Patescibacteria group bacterium]
MTNIITVKNISKKYNITHQQGGYVALRDVMTNVAKSPFSFLKHKAKEAVGKAGKEDFWALNDINFEVQKGEAIGIIGANGAGKSTLLKILTGITPPTTGEITMRGKVASLLEVGTGFHPELTGRENIFLNGTILGMTKKEINAKFNDIVQFAGIQKFIDTPVKRYSSGMHVRLGFSVAAHMEPDILLVDEVLAVGDAEFQKKCLGKMNEVTKKSRRTILFVSHNMSAIQNLCKRSVLLRDGRVEMIGETEKVVDKYLNNQTNSLKTPLKDRKDRRGNGIIKFINFHIEDERGNVLDDQNIKSGSNITFVFDYKCDDVSKALNIDVGLSLHTHDFSTLSVLYSSYLGKIFQNISPIGEFRFKLKELMLIEGDYKIGARITVDGSESDWPQNGVGSFKVNQNDFYISKNKDFKNKAPLLLNGEWKITTNK